MAVTLCNLVRPERFELPACGFEVRRSIRLSYGRSGERCLSFLGLGVKEKMLVDLGKLVLMFFRGDDSQVALCFGSVGCSGSRLTRSGQTHVFKLSSRFSWGDG